MAGVDSQASGWLILMGVGSLHSPFRNRDRYKSTSGEPFRLPLLPLAKIMVRPSGVNVMHPSLIFGSLIKDDNGTMVFTSTLAPLVLALYRSVNGVPVAS